MAILPRSSVIQPGDTIRVSAVFRNVDGVPEDLDSFPQVTIVHPNGSVAVGPTSAGVYRMDVGTYGFNYPIGLYPYIGVWTDIWEGQRDGFSIYDEFNFQVNTTQLPAINTDGYAHLGDDPGFNYSQVAIRNINLLIKSLRARLKASGVHKVKDEFGNDVYRQCDIFNVDELVSFLAMSLSMFNQVPHFTGFTFEDTGIIELCHAILVQGAVIVALSGQALIERGREFNINDNGIGFTPPTMSEILNSQYGTELTNYTETIKYLKDSMRSSPLGLGTLSITNGASTQVRALRNLRSRQIL